jgi:hypothetical protein
MENFIRVYDNVLDKEFCTHLIKKFSEYEKMNFVLNRQQSISQRKKHQQDSDVVLMCSLLIDNFLKEEIFNRLNPHASRYMNEFSIMAEMSQMEMQQLKLQRYKIGQGFHEWHCEVNGLNQCHRVFNWQVFLNDVEEGGETEFLYLHKRIKPKMGSMLVFPSYFTHAHRGHCPLSGEKYILNGWVNFG